MPTVAETLAARRSVRGFRPDPVDPELLREIFAAAQRAPSWCNVQPWRVTVTSGDATRRLTRAFVEAATREAPSPDFAWPAEFPEPYNGLRRECGKSLYTAMGVARGDAEGRKDAWLRNYAAFDAPHVAIVSMDPRLGLYAALDVGCWLQSLMLAAWERGVASCAQASLSTHPGAARRELGLGDGEGVLVGVALGYEDASVAANACRTPRAPLGDNVRFVE